MTRGPEFEEHDVKKLLRVLELARTTIAWADQCREGIATAAGGRHYVPNRDAFWSAYLRYMGRRAAFRGDVPGCSCPMDHADEHTPDPRCFYHLAAGLQPWNHRIPWNCPTYFDGCNCDAEEE